MILGWAAYGLGSWGYCLIRGWDVPFRAWFSPLNPYQFPPGGTPPPIPDTKLFPGSAAAAGKHPVDVANPAYWQQLGQQIADQFGPPAQPGPFVSKGGQP
jgi:hypothetical protein